MPARTRSSSCSSSSNFSRVGDSWRAPTIGLISPATTSLAIEAARVTRARDADYVVFAMIIQRCLRLQPGYLRHAPTQARE